MAALAHGDDDAAVEMLAAGGPIDAEPFELVAEPLVGNPQAERAVGHADTEALPQLRVVQAAGGEVIAGRPALRRRNTRRVVVGDLFQDPRVLRRVLQGTRQARNRR